MMPFRKVSYLIPSCDGCGLAWSFGDPGCVDGIPPHFTSKAAAIAELPAKYGWQIARLGADRLLMVCRRCCATGVIPESRARLWLLAVAGAIRRWVPFGPVRPLLSRGLMPGHPESLARLSAEEEELLAAMDAEVFPEDES